MRKKRAIAPIVQETAIDKQSGSSSTESDIEIWDDVEWAPALAALQGWQPGLQYTGKSDPGPLARLLQSGKPVPEAVAKQLGLWLDPPWGTKGPRLAVIVPKRYYPGTSSIKSEISVRKKIEQLLQAEDKVEAAVQQVMIETGRSRSYVMKAWALSDREIVRRTSEFNPDPFLSPRERE